MAQLPTRRILLMGGAAVVALVLIIVLLTHSLGGAKRASTVTKASINSTSTASPQATSTTIAHATATAAILPSPTPGSNGGSSQATATPTTAPSTPTPQPVGTPTPDPRPPNLVVSPINAQVTCGTPTTVGKYPPLIFKNDGGGIVHWNIWVLTYGQGFDLNYPVVASMYASGIKADQEQIVYITQAKTKTFQSAATASPAIGIGPARVIMEIIGGEYPESNPLVIDYYCTNLH